MKKLITTLALFTVIAGPAFAHGYDPASNIGEIHPEWEYNKLYAHSAADALARAQRHEHTKPAVSVPAIGVDGTVVGADPDPNVRLELRRDDVKDY
jgi:hypothetical protein